MITPSELRQYEFKPAGRNAYKSDDVDLLFGQILVDYEKMYRENSELIKRVSLLADKLEQYKKDEVDIKQAVLSAQKAADIIVRDAEESIADAKAEAEAILAAAKGEAQIIKSDAEKQAIADSDLLLSIARDKAEEILNKAKEKSHEIIIEANATASDKVGAATRTITSESLHYDMLKKEVSEFRASILSQYKAHIELISKLPELAVEEAAKLEADTDDLQEEASAQESVEVDEVPAEDNSPEELFDIYSEDREASSDIEAEDVITYTFGDDASENADSFASIPTYDEQEEVSTVTEESVAADVSVSKRRSISADDLYFDGFDNEDSEDVQADIPIFADNNIEDGGATAQTNFFNSIESVETDSDDEGGKKKFGFFHRKK